jgi:PadR family transcriptional regulator PadR
MRRMVTKTSYTSLIDNFGFELRRGALVLAVLSQLSEEKYGYSLKKQLSDLGLEINEGTLYPLLRRLEDQGLLQSEWRVIDEARPRRYYKTNTQGERALKDLKAEWKHLSASIDALFN